MLCRLALALVCGLALPAPSPADNTLPNPNPVAPKLRQADWKLVSSGPTESSVKANRILYARVPAQADAWKPRLPKQAAGVLRQNFSHTGLLAIFLTDPPFGSTIGGVYPSGDGGLTVEIREPPPPPPFVCPPPSQTCPAPSIPAPIAVPQYTIITIRKGSLPAPVKRLYITEVS